MLIGAEFVMTMAPLEYMRVLITINSAFWLISAAVADGFGLSTIEIRLKFQQSQCRIPAYAEEPRINYDDSTVESLAILEQRDLGTVDWMYRCLYQQLWLLRHRCFY